MGIEATGRSLLGSAASSAPSSVFERIASLRRSGELVTESNLEPLLTSVQPLSKEAHELAHLLAEGNLGGWATAAIRMTLSDLGYEVPQGKVDPEKVISSHVFEPDPLRGKLLAMAGVRRRERMGVVDDGYDAQEFKGKSIHFIGDPAPNDGVVDHGTPVAALVEAHTGLVTLDLTTFQLSNTTMDGYAARIAAAIDRVAPHDSIVCISQSAEPTDEARAVLQAAFARYPRTLFVVAAGNNAQRGVDLDQNPKANPVATSGAPNVITVASCDVNGALSWFSHYGAKSVALAARGEGIVAPVSATRYDSLMGSSFSAPQVASIAGFVRDVCPGLLPEQVEFLLGKTAVPSASLKGKTQFGGVLDGQWAMRVATFLCVTGKGESPENAAKQPGLSKKGQADLIAIGRQLAQHFAQETSRAPRP
jgi:hypothetical protein